ncbi:sulfite exporter TauE/SafE family protein [Natranaeroarchaeum aerophilus]|uniref:Sulfite exporter TauE/SafE family protein n=1 Tax=Natranaeroarchaeum aerophilus TaxID=2917711 RepID=A0AAE3K4D7_9EURY|nr:sulfite exporter TauE/SafE family protein [Natranaeroarchaeum aerophilus]MCL9813071.1 sulfite exporter TauE/SafE family protein [Natranaeroarchaeum aerophilus]
MGSTVLAVIGGGGISTTEFGVFLLVGLLAGAHCLGMCGPLVTTYGDRISASRDDRRSDTLSWFEVRQHGLFNLGRTFSYAAIGGLFGLLGAAAFASSDAITAAGDSVRASTGIVVGIAIILAGVYYLRGQSGVPGGRVPLFGAVFGRLSGLITSRVDRLATSGGIVGLGAIHGLLPCPIIYPAYLYAFATGDPIRGALALGVLGLGTIPTLFVYGTFIQAVSATSRRRVHRALGAAFILLGYIPLQHGLMLYGIHLPHPPLPHYQPL